MYQPLSSLNIPESRLKELRNSGYSYCKDVDIDIPFWDVLTQTPKAKTALEKLKEESQEGYVSTFINPLDDALHGGLPLGKITELCGEPGTGKTQICFQLCVSTQLPNWCGGLNGDVVYIGTNYNFAPHRVREIARGVVNRYTDFKMKRNFGNDVTELSVESIMDRIFYLNVQSDMELIAAVSHLKEWLPEHLSVKLVIIDSICTLLRSLNGTERTNILYILFRNLQKLAQIYNFAIVVTNDKSTRISSAKDVYQAPSLGGSHYHRINIRIELSKKSSIIFRAVVLKNLFSSPTEIEFPLFT
ncbi:hypothetical protein FQA39_LY04387 [Lamprigera yunnana]|nr:hypothetical protein FQA39_LY04387 [Lamprigera yunnana]